jgi:hypothetical protein
MNSGLPGPPFPLEQEGWDKKKSTNQSEKAKIK